MWATDDADVVSTDDACSDMWRPQVIHMVTTHDTVRFSSCMLVICVTNQRHDCTSILHSTSAHASLHFSLRFFLLSCDESGLMVKVDFKVEGVELEGGCAHLSFNFVSKHETEENEERRANRALSSKKANPAKLCFY